MSHPTADQLRRRSAALREAIDRKRKSVARALTDAGVDRLLGELRELQSELGQTLRSIPAAVERERKSLPSPRGSHVR